MTKQLSIGALALIAFLASGASANASHVEQIDLKQFFDTDAVVNGSSVAGIDQTQDAMDNDGNTLITKGAANAYESCANDPDGLPNDGKFAKNSKHPLVKLGFSNAKNGNNVRQMEGGDTFEVDLPQGKYRQIHVFATSGEGPSDITVTEVYGGDSELNALTVWDWFDPEPDYGYALAGGMDRARADASSCFDDDGATVWGYRIKVDRNTRLNSVGITRTDGSGSFLNLMGITAVRSRSH